MSPKAKMGSLEAVEAFRANLVVYIAQTRSALEEISADVMRTRLWIETDQRRYWEAELRRRRRDLEEAQQALFSVRLSMFTAGVSLEQMAAQRAKRAMEEGEAKLRAVKRWDRDFEGAVQPLVKQMEKLHTILSSDLVKALAELKDIIATIVAYTAPEAGSVKRAGGTGAAGAGPGPTDEGGPIGDSKPGLE